MFYPSILAFIITGCCSCIFGMDPVPMPDNQMIAWKIILQDGVQWFDYRVIKSLVVSKKHDKLLRDTAQCRKIYLIKQLHLKSNNLTWDKHGAMCGHVEFESDGLHVRRFYLHQYGYRRQPVTIYYGKFEIPLPHHPRPYFNNRGAFCFYTYSTSYRDEKKGFIYKNKWRSSRQSSELGLCTQNCMAHIGDQEVTLTMFLEFPVLLKALLKSRIVYKRRQNGWGGCNAMKIYDLDGVTIPENYKQYQPYFSTPLYASFKDLPRVIRKPIVARYKAQDKKNLKLSTAE